MNYYEQQWTEVRLATYATGRLFTDLIQYDEDGEYFGSETYTEDEAGYRQYVNNSGTVDFAEALYSFKLDLDCFHDGTEFSESMFTADYHHANAVTPF